VNRGRCKRSNGTERAWFHTRETAEAFAEDSKNSQYHGDIAHECPFGCGWHLSRPEWIAQPGDVITMNSRLYRVFERRVNALLLYPVTEEEAEVSSTLWLQAHRARVS
jgi:hypothetical protein